MFQCACELEALSKAARKARKKRNPALFDFRSRVSGTRFDCPLTDVK
jgi:hypothetical protein